MRAADRRSIARLLAHFWFVLAVIPCLIAAPGPAAAQATGGPEEDLIRAELRRIIAEDPQEADKARAALEALDQPPTTQTGRQMRNRRERGARRIVNGTPSQGHPAVGALLRGADPRSARFHCTGTLVGCDKFLTAAHCIEAAPSGPYLVFFQDLGFFAVREVRWEKDQYAFPYFDLAMLTLARPVEGIAPMPINMTVKPLNKSIATIVGFGRTGGSRYDYGVKRDGSVRLDACPASYASKKLLCWTFDADVKSRPPRANTCNGDSGGGIFMRDQDGHRIVDKVFGVVSGGREDSSCVKDDLSFNVDIFEFRAWLQAAGEGRLTSRMCGMPILDTTAPAAKRHLLQISDSQPQVVEPLDVPADVSTLHVAMNGEDTGPGKNDFDLLVYAGDASADATPVCREDGPGQFAFCAIERPASGRWTVVVKRKQGEGNVQITASFARRN
jgi:hypothetical protein